MLGNHKGWMIALASVVLSAGSAQAQIKVGITMSASGPGAALGQPQIEGRDDARLAVAGA